MTDYALNYHLVALNYHLFGNTRDTSVMHEKAKFVCFNYMQQQKVNFKSVQINMKQVSYIRTFHYSILLNSTQNNFIQLRLRSM